MMRRCSSPAATRLSGQLGSSAPRICRLQKHTTWHRRWKLQRWSCGEIAKHKATITEEIKKKSFPRSENSNHCPWSSQGTERFPAHIFTLSVFNSLSHPDGVWTLYSSNWADGSDNKPALVQQNLQEALLPSATHRWRSVTPFPSAAVHRFSVSPRVVF